MESTANSNPLVAEMKIALLAVNLASSFSCDKISLEGDSLLVSKAVLERDLSDEIVSFRVTLKQSVRPACHTRTEKCAIEGLGTMGGLMCP